MDEAPGRELEPRPPGEPSATDPRLLQANERTMLAWTRTSIALMTFGFVIARIGAWLRALAASHDDGELRPFGTVWIGAAFVALGAITNAIAVHRYVRARRAIREGRDVGGDTFPVVFASLITVLGAIMGGYILYRLL